MSLFGALDISASALSAERQRSEVAATNLANVDTTHTAAGSVPYHRHEVVFTSSARFQNVLGDATFHRSQNPNAGVRLTQVVEDSSAALKRYDPTHPDADTQGYVAYPNINPVQEMVDLMGSVRAYQLNASAITASKQLIQQSIDILKS